jgi:hypothetical protein
VSISNLMTNLGRLTPPLARNYRQFRHQQSRGIIWTQRKRSIAASRSDHRMDGNDHEFDEPRRTKTEFVLFILVLLTLEVVYFGDALRPGWILSAADWLLASESYRKPGEPDYEPSNRLLTDIACQMDPWLDLAAREWHEGRVPLWNPFAGCGAPLLANAQSAVFSPINWIYFTTQSPYAWVAMAMVKLFVAGVGAYLLARELRLGAIGRWFVGLCFPFSGFIVVWLQYPMGSVAIWLPWVIWLVERLIKHPSAARAGWLGLVLSVLHLSGHPETTAHILVVACAIWLWRCVGAERKGSRPWHSLGWCSIAVFLSLVTTAVQLVPTAEYLMQSEALAQRSAHRMSLLEFRTPELLAMPALVAPYVYGSYLRGQPHVEKAFHVENFNEIAGGYTGLVTLCVLVPLAIQARRRYGWIPFWFALDGVCLAVVYHVPPFDNLVRLVPVLNVTQNERLLLIVSLAHCLLAGAALDSWSILVEPGGHRFRLVLASVLFASAAVLAVAAGVVRVAGPTIEQRAASHFEDQARGRGLPAKAFENRAREMAERAVRFFPRYYSGLAVAVTILGGVVIAASTFGSLRARIGVLAICVFDLFLFGRNYNPAIPISQYFPATAVTDFLLDATDGRAGPLRVLSLEEELPPNVLGRYRIADLRNYDAIEVRRVLDLFEPLWPRERGRRTSNSWATWERVQACSDLLRLANVGFIISTNTPPADGSSDTEVFGRVFVQRLDAAPGVLFCLSADGDDSRLPEPMVTSIGGYVAGHLEASVRVPQGANLLVFSETFMPGWQARIDGQPRDVTPYREAFNSIAISPGDHRVQFDYSPTSFRLGLLLSSFGILFMLSLWSTAIYRRFR